MLRQTYPARHTDSSCDWSFNVSLDSFYNLTERKFMNKVFFTLVLTCLTLFALAFAQVGETVANGLNGPMGLMVDTEGNVWVVESGVGGDQVLEMMTPEGTANVQVGDTSRILKIAPDGTQTEVAVLPSVFMGQNTSGGSRLATLDGTVYATSGVWIDVPGTDPLPKTAVIVKVADGEATQVADTWAFENANNPDGFIKESHPYGLAAHDGMLLVADAGANDLLRVDPASGEVSLVAVFDGVPGMIPNDRRGGAQENDPVPTGVTVGADGNIYVSFLPGFPPLPGSAKVVKVTPEGDVSDYATDLNILTDLQAAPDGNLYAVQMADFGEQGPTPGTGRVLRITDGQATEVLAGLSFPTAIAFNAAGDAYLTINGAGAPGTGEVVKFAGLAAGQ